MGITWSEGRMDSTEEPKVEDEGAEGEAGETLEDESSGAHFEPLVQLAEVQVCTGEEDEEVVYSSRAKLYRWGEDVKGEKMWKERGTGECKLLKHHDTGKIRVLLRVDKTRKIRLNHYLSADLELSVNPTSDKAWTYITTDYSDEKPELSQLCIKFKDPETANAFKENWDKIRSGIGADQPDDDKAEEEV